MMNDACKKCLVIGAGPAGLGVARELSNHGIDVTIYERGKITGGLMNLIPERRLNRKAIEHMSKGIKVEFGREVDLNKLDEYTGKFDYIVIATGAQKPKALGVVGENLPKVYYAVDYLEREIKEKRVAVIGGGNVAVDCAIKAVERGGQSVIYYRKSREFMRADKKEIEYAEKIGVKFQFNAVFDDVSKIDADIVVIAIGQLPDVPSVLSDKIFVCGDANLGASTIAEAVKDARAVAKTILQNIFGHSSNQV